MTTLMLSTVQVRRQLDSGCEYHLVHNPNAAAPDSTKRTRYFFLWLLACSGLVFLFYHMEQVVMHRRHPSIGRSRPEPAEVRPQPAQTSYCPSVYSNHSGRYIVHHSNNEANLVVESPSRPGGYSPQCSGGFRKRLPSALIIGAKKAGTGALIQFLNFHCNISIAIDEVHFFDIMENYEKGFDWYMDQMSCSCPDQVTVEKSPAYFNVAIAPKRIREMNAHIKLLLIVKEPVRRLLSDYMQIYTKKKSRGKVMQRIEKLALDENGNVNEDFVMIQKSIYANFMDVWLTYFKRNQFLILNGDNLVINPAQELAKVEQFLGLSHQLTGEKFYFNEQKGFFCHRSGADYHCGSHSPVQSPHISSEGCLGTDKGRKQPFVDAELLQKLKEFYRPHNRRFFTQIGETFPGWDV